MHFPFASPNLLSSPRPGWTPSSLLQCFGDDGGIDVRSYLSYQQHMSNVALAAAAAASASKRLLDDQEESTASPSKRPRGPKKIFAYREEGGELEHLTPKDTVWYKLYVLHPMPEDEDWSKNFRSRFRLPYHCYVELLHEASQKKWFPRWARMVDRKRSSPLELLILGALRYLGRGWTFDDLEESTAISAEVHRVFFHQFVKIGSTVLYKKYVVSPSSAEEARAHFREYEAAGLHRSRVGRLVAEIAGVHYFHLICFLHRPLLRGHI